MDEKICTSCGRQKEMYYKLWCPICEKPIIESVEFYNLIKCLDHIEAIGHSGYKDRMWNYIMDYVQGNDSMIHLYNDNEANEDIKLLFDTFDIKEEMMDFYVSW